METKRVVFVGCGRWCCLVENFPRNGNLVFLIFVETGRAPLASVLFVIWPEFKAGGTRPQILFFSEQPPGSRLPAARR